MKSISELTEEEKSLMLAELVNERTNMSMRVRRWEPYNGNDNGLAQFAAILLNPEFVKVMKGDTFLLLSTGWYEGYAPTRSNILNEILIMQNKAKR